MSMTQRIQNAKDAYIDSMPSICYERALIWTQSHQKTEGEPTPIRRAKAFKSVCEQLSIKVFEDELIVGASGNFKRSGILTPEFSWKWVDKEMDSFEHRPQDPYRITDEQKAFIRKEIFPYWKGKSLEEHYLLRVPEETAHILIDTGIIDNDSKWRQAIGEITPDYEDILFVKGYRGIIDEAKAKLKTLRPLTGEALDKITFYKSVILVSEGIIQLANRYGDKLEERSLTESDASRKKELLKMASVCKRVPEHPPETFHEAVQFVWFVQLGGVLSENPLALNLGRFDQYMYPYYKADIEAGRMTHDEAQELVDALWLKLSEWVWTISANTADFFAGYNQFQNLTVGGRKRDGNDGTNAVSYMALEATKRVKTHQPGLSVRISPDGPEAFMRAVLELVKEGTGFPAIHSDRVGAQMLLQAGYEPEAARDWSNCGCVVPHYRKTGQWTAAVNVNFGAALEYALNQGKSRLDGKFNGLQEIPLDAFKSYEEVKEAFFKQLSNLVEHSVVGTVIAQQLHSELVPRPFLSTVVDGCMQKGIDLNKGGALYNVGPVLTGIGIGVVANSLAVIKKLVFEEGTMTLEALNSALNGDWEGYEELREKAESVPKYGNDDPYVDAIATEISNYYYTDVRGYNDLFGSKFNTAFMGISNYIPAGKIVGATPCGRKAKKPLTEGVSPFVGTDTSSPLAAMKSAAKLNHDVHTGGTLLNLRLSKDLLKNNRGLFNLGSMIQSYFNMGAFHVQFNVISNELLRKAQANPENYRDLLVRVAGYSTQFVNLSKEVQDAIIARTEHEHF